MRPVALVTISLILSTPAMAQSPGVDRALWSQPATDDASQSQATDAGPSWYGTPTQPAASANSASANAPLQIQPPPARLTPVHNVQPVSGHFVAQAQLPDRRGGTMPLAPPSGERLNSLATSQRSVGSTHDTLVTVGSSLAVVLGLFFVVVWLARRGTAGGPAAIPSEVLSVVGTATFANRQQLQLVRVGEKLLLVAVAGGSATTLTEIVDPTEVQRLLTACETSRPGSATDTFRQVLAQLSDEPAEEGFFGSSGRGRARGIEAAA